MENVLKALDAELGQLNWLLKNERTAREAAEKQVAEMDAIIKALTAQLELKEMGNASRP